MSWILLVIAGLLETAFAFCLGKAKGSAGHDVYFWYASFFFVMLASMALLMKAIQGLPIGTAYVVWTGIGAIGTVLVGILFFKEPISFWRLFFISTLVISLIGLKVSSH